MNPIRKTWCFLAASALLAGGAASAASRPGKAGFDRDEASSLGGRAGDRRLPERAGPRDGFPDSRGIRHAIEQSNEHSAHHRGDSPSD